MGFTASPSDVGPNFEPMRESTELVEPQERNIPNPQTLLSMNKQHSYTEIADISSIQKHEIAIGIPIVTEGQTVGKFHLDSILSNSSGYLSENAYKQPSPRFN